jgi:hypothetical protein
MKEVIEEVEITFTHKNIIRTITKPQKVTVIRSTTPNLLKIVVDNNIIYYPFTSINGFRLIIKEIDERVLM